MKLPILRKWHLSEHKSHLSYAHICLVLCLLDLVKFSIIVQVVFLSSLKILTQFLTCSCLASTANVTLALHLWGPSSSGWKLLLSISTVLLSQNIYLPRVLIITVCARPAPTWLSVFIRKSGLRNSPAALLLQFMVSSGALVVKLVVKIANVHWALVPLLQYVQKFILSCLFICLSLQQKSM